MKTFRLVDIVQPVREVMNVKTGQVVPRAKIEFPREFLKQTAKIEVTA